MAAVATTGGRREARRRRILQRGSDRLALITGRIESLPPDPDQSRSTPTPASQTPADSAQHEDVAPSSSLPNQESGTGPIQHDSLDVTVEPLARNNDKGIATRAATLFGVEKELSQISSSMRNPSLQGHLVQQGHRSLLTAAQISSAVAATENIRLCCSVAAAILVILSYIEFPFPAGPIIRSVVILRPVYLLLLTNMSIVFARPILRTQGAESRTGRSRGSTFGGNGLADQLGKALDMAFLLQKIFVALFNDFSIYTVVLICGLSLVRRLGW